ncbi:metallophosphoesterase [Mucilaginibacter sp. Bleaf8]|uniref:metallophosphoesterase n=1 Tax=Mucilaginibacter sp. Bleaf8 TaxID=2834430 RepID=UPI001BCF827A|nr:metallophosphoesterase [Mucilaginibacter sp. Bleaf8]MBS7563051.1 metallophosphoesterase [Mucilaginibacter sp. Bleaf8]
MLILMGISFLLDWYVYHGLKTLVTDKSTLTKNIVLWGYLLISIIVTLLLFTVTSGSVSTRGMSPRDMWILSIFLGLLVTKVVFVQVLFIGDISRLIIGAVNLLRDKPGVEGYIPGRRKFVSTTALALAAVPFGSFLYAIFKGKYDYKVHRQTLYFEDLPEAFDGFTITQLSDIHSGSFDNADAVAKGIKLANDQKSDLFVFTGDLVNNGAWEIEPYIHLFSQLKAPYGQFSILGNHDYGDYIEWNSRQEKAANLDKLKTHHKDLGYRLLLDENVELTKDGQKIVLIGVQNWGRGFIQVGDLDKALKGVEHNDFKVLLSHDPTHWEDVIRYHPSNIHITLSGHTHGAQFGVETDSVRWSPVKYRYLDWAGLASQNNRYLYVNRGFGFLAFSGRLGIWPEITVITLKKKLA